MLEAVQGLLPSLPRISLFTSLSGVSDASGPPVVPIQFRTTPDIAILMLVLLTYALARYFVLLHCLLQSFPSHSATSSASMQEASVTPPAHSKVKDEPQHPPIAADDRKVTDPCADEWICKTLQEKHAVRSEDNHRLPKEQGRHPITPPVSPDRRMVQRSESAQLADEVISGTDSAAGSEVVAQGVESKLANK